MSHFRRSRTCFHILAINKQKKKFNFDFTFLGLVSSYKMNRHEVEAAMSKITENDGWMSQYNVDHKFSSPWRVHESMKSIAYLPAALKTLEEQLATTLGNYRSMP